MNKIEHSNYSIHANCDRIEFDYIKTPRNWFYMLFYGAIGATLTAFPFYILFKSKHFIWTPNTIVAVIFFSLTILWGLYKMAVAFEPLFLPTKSFITIDKLNKQVQVKLSFFRRLTLPYNKIREIQLSGHDSITESNEGGVVYKRRLYYHRLQLLLNDGSIRKIHTFFAREIHIPLRSAKETYEVSAISKQIAKLISHETGIKYTWLGTKRR